MQPLGAVSLVMIPAVALVFLVLNGTVPPAYLMYAVIGAAVVWIAHADNIDRLLHGTERKFDLRLLSGRGGGGGAS